MFNMYFHDQATEKAKTEEIQKQKHLKSISAQIKVREKLATNNRKRIEKRIIEMAQDPIPINRHEKSSELPNFKGECFIRSRPKDTKQRIKESEISNTWLDTIPLLPSPHNFRPRFKEKEINPDMKYKPRDRYERVADTWESQRVFLDNSWEVKNFDPVSQKIAGKYFPNRLRKSYYKTIESVALDLAPNIKPLPVNTLEGTDGLVPSTERSLAEIAKEVMDKCKLRPIKRSQGSSII